MNSSSMVSALVKDTIDGRATWLWIDPVHDLIFAFRPTIPLSASTDTGGAAAEVDWALAEA